MNNFVEREDESDDDNIFETKWFSCTATQIHVCEREIGQKPVTERGKKVHLLIIRRSLAPVDDDD